MIQNSHKLIPVIFEDEDFLAISKPSGMTVNNSETTKGGFTVQDWSEEYLKIPRKVNKHNNEDLNPDTYDTFYDRAGIVHRLDKETSGILLIAKNPEAFSELQRQFKERIVKKTYLALAHGIIAPSEGVINVPVGRLPWNRRQFGVVAGGRDAVTRYKVIAKYEIQNANSTEDLSLVECYPETGRTHQIRVHLKYLGHPIYADYLYAGRKTQRGDRLELNRVFLHAARITFLHPRTGVLVELECKLPQELESTLDRANLIPL